MKWQRLNDVGETIIHLTLIALWITITIHNVLLSFSFFFLFFLNFFMIFFQKYISSFKIEIIENLNL